KVGICIEDLYAAGLIVKSLKDRGIRHKGDMAEIATLMARVELEEMRRIIKESASATIVKGVGHEDDVDYCLKLDEVDLTPISRGLEVRAAIL
ncbi:MAG: 2-phosphosulfolactate phosphatase, partial [Candidatus Bathyarchaeia archaeon]